MPAQVLLHPVSEQRPGGAGELKKTKFEMGPLQLFYCTMDSCCVLRLWLQAGRSYCIQRKKDAQARVRMQKRDFIAPTSKAYRAKPDRHSVFRELMDHHKVVVVGLN